MSRQFLGSHTSFTRQESRFLIIPAPFDVTASYGTGARFGPARIIEASQQLELFDEELLCEPWKAAIHTQEPLDLPVVVEKAQEVISSAVRMCLEEEKLPILLGGDHSVSIGAIRAAHNHYGQIDILQLDAHADLRDEYQGTCYSHACVMRRIWGLGNVIQAGIRSLSSREWEFLKDQGRTPVFAKDILAETDNALEKICRCLSGRPLYITVDVDCMDPSVMPATGTPEPGGLQWQHILRLLGSVIHQADVIGLDVVELAPVPGLHYPEYTVARLIYKIIGYIAYARGLLDAQGPAHVSSA